MLKINDLKRISRKIMGGQRLTWIQAALLVVSIVGVFGVLSIWAPVDVLLIALVFIAFAGGAGLGKGAIVLVPLTVAAIGVRAELVAVHPVEVRSFLLGGVAIAVVLGSVAFVGTRIRRLLRRPSARQQPNV